MGKREIDVLEEIVNGEVVSDNIGISWLETDDAPYQRLIFSVVVTEEWLIRADNELVKELAHCVGQIKLITEISKQQYRREHEGRD